MLDAIPDLIEKKKISGRDLPTEVFIKKKRKLAGDFHGDTYFCKPDPFVLVAFWKEKQVLRGGKEAKYVEAIKISPAEGSHF